MTTTPFIARREAILCPPSAPYWNALPPAMKQPFCLSCWSVPTIQNYVAMLQAFGFNAIQLTDIPQVWINEGTDAVTWRLNLAEFARAARTRGMGVSLFIWGNAVNLPQGQDHLCPHDPASRKILDEWYDRQAELAPLIDQFVSHWFDPGGAKLDCPQCTIRTAQELHNDLLRRMRARNPNVRSFFSTWQLAEGNWPGYSGGAGKPRAENDPRRRWRAQCAAGLRTLLGNGGLAADVGIALGLMNCGADGVHLDFAGELDRGDLEQIRAAGRAAGVWAWYTTDYEILPSLHVHTDLLQNYFRSLPAETHDLLAWHSVDDNNHGLNMPNLYVAGRLLQNPVLDARQVLGEFARDYFGPAAEPALQALRVVELVRTASRRYDQELADPSLALHAEPDGRRAVSVGWRQERLAEVRAAQQALAGAAVPAGHQPSFPALLTPAQYLEELRAHLAALGEMLEFLEAEAHFGELARHGAAPEKLREARAALPVVHTSDRHLVHLERWIYEERLAKLGQTPR